MGDRFLSTAILSASGGLLLARAVGLEFGGGSGLLSLSSEPRTSAALIHLGSKVTTKQQRLQLAVIGLLTLLRLARKSPPHENEEENDAGKSTWRSYFSFENITAVTSPKPRRQELLLEIALGSQQGDLQI